jgi:hypothetical protein
MADTPQFHPGWDVGIPDIGASAISGAANAISQNIASAGKDIGANLKQNSATDGLLQTFATMKDPSTKKPMIDPDTMANISKQSLPAKQQFIGMLSGSIAQQTQQANELQGQKNLLGYFQQDKGALATKLMMGMAPGQRPPMGNYNMAPQAQQQPQQPAQQSTQQQQAQPAAQSIPTPNNAAIHGYFNSQENFKGNPVHVLRGPSGNIVSVVDPSGKPVSF